MYRQAQRHLESSNFNLAIKTLQSLESRYPFGKYAEQAQLEIVFAHYGAYEFEAAIESSNRFIRLHPQHPNIDYAYYMKGMATYSLDENFLTSLFPTDDSKRDVSRIRKAFSEFAQLLARYPDSRYASDARARMVFMRNMLARHEIHVANYYFRRGAYLAALKRGQHVVENLQQTPSVPDGLAVMAQAYSLLNQPGLAADAIRVLCSNYPEHPMLDPECQVQTRYSFENTERSWINRATRGLFDPPKPPQFNYEPGNS